MTQREIKFRAWDKEKKIMDYNPSIPAFGDINNIYLNGWFSENSYFILQQFTGLKDKNGKEIYEGDILELKHNDRVVLKHIVVWNEKRCGWSDYEPKNEFEVIGNIYENPELLNL